MDYGWKLPEAAGLVDFEKVLPDAAGLVELRRRPLLVY